MICNLGVPRTGTVYVQRTLSPVRPHGHYVSVPSDWSYANFKPLPDEYRDDYKIAFVRNPFDLLVSHYALLRRMDVLMHYYDRSLVWLDFRSYVTQLANRRHLYPQRYPLFFQLFDETWGLVPDYLGRYETLDADLRRIAEITGATYTPTGRVNASEHADWRTYYDNALYEVAEDAWFADLAFFGYDRAGPTEGLVTYGPQPTRRNA